MVDQSRVTANSRSAPATYTGIMDDIRKAFAKANGVSPSLFSFNSEGSCPECSGLGVIYTDLAFMEGDRLPSANSARASASRPRCWRIICAASRSADVLEMTAEEALAFFTEKKVRPVLQAMNDVGLGYLKLGQPLSTLSGGECQRLKLATELHKKGSVYVMDEPTTGLHLSDIGMLMRLDRPAGGQRQHGDPDRAPPGRDPAGRLDHRPRPGRRQRGRRGAVPGTTGGLKACQRSLTGQFI